VNKQGVGARGNVFGDSWPGVDLGCPAFSDQHIFFATDPRVADCYAKPSRMRFILPGTWQKNIIVSRLLLVREAHITTTGCTGGTVKVSHETLAMSVSLALPSTDSHLVHACPCYRSMRVRSGA
jgi:hypothetical protein